MNTEQRMAVFVQLGQTMGILAADSRWQGFACGLTEIEFNDFQQLISTHHHRNGWFTEANIRKALMAWSKALTAENLSHFISKCSLETTSSKRIAIICAGNIPMVGLHDLMCVLLSGHKALLKLSSDDALLIPALLNMMMKFSPELESHFAVVEGQLKGYEAVIATGSNNTSRYFNYYFRDVPHIIRKSRTSVAVLNGKESKEELYALGADVFDYFGLGCRNVSHLCMPDGYDLNKFFNGIYSYHDVINHNKYANNYDYNKAVWLLNREDLLDNGFLLLRKEHAVQAPTASLSYSYYSNEAELQAMLQSKTEEIQCIVGHGYIPFGEAQTPQLWDYADGIDTMEWIARLV